jgi:16S rRNA (guanine966-N2)-methyltransferase
MRIVSGKFGGRKLYVPKGRDIRPTSDKVRGAIFNALQSRGVLDGAQVIDGFCGSGALGLEAISRGAAHGVFIDKNRASLDAARDNAGSFGLKDEVFFMLRDAVKPGARPQNILPATLVFLDPPYRQDLLNPALEALHEGQWLESGAFLVCEVEKECALSAPGLFALQDERIYGDTKIRFLRYANTPE